MCHSGAAWRKQEEKGQRGLYNLMAVRGSRRPLRSEEAREIFFSLMEEIWKMNWKHNIGPQCLNMKINPKGINSLTLEFSQHSNSSGSDWDLSYSPFALAELH